jgi:hypothetical protein
MLVFHLQIWRGRREHDTIFEDPSQLEKIPDHCYGNLRRVRIIGFFARKMEVKLICHILENAPWLECLTLGITDGECECSSGGEFRENYASKATLAEAPKALEAIRTYIEGKVPSTAKLIVLEPCKRCAGG